jgi:D-3-phosphoglycerate dehydrogenase
MPTVVVAYDEFNDTQVEEAVLKSIDARVIHSRNLNTPEALEAAKQADALMVTIQQVTADVLATLEKCKIISRVGTGLDAIDIPAATQRGIWVTNVPDYSVDEVSTHAMALLLAHARRIPDLVESTRRGSWDKMFVRPIQRLRGQTLGLLGFGRIGQAVASKARGFGLEIIVYDPYVDAQKLESMGVRPVDLDTLLRTSDYISLHAPLTESNQHIINEGALDKMKPTAFLINTARGALIDEDALLKALRSKQIAGAALDVFAVEPPPPDHPLLHEPRAMITPHIAWYSEAANHDVRVRGAEEVVRVLRGEKPIYPANSINSL